MRTNTRKFRLALSALMLVALLLAVFGAMPVQAATPIYVDASRPDDTGDGTSWATAKKTIQAGINAVDAGGTVNVAAGTYAENNISVADKRISVVGAGSDATHLDVGSGYGFKITAGGHTPSPGCIHVSGFDIYGAGRGSGYALFFETGAGGTSEADKCTWENNKIHDMNYGVKTNNRDPRPQYWAFRNNEYYEIRIPLLLEYTYYVDIVGNTLEDYKEGVQMDYGGDTAKHWRITDNTFLGDTNYPGDRLAAILISSAATDVEVLRNNIQNSIVGILVKDGPLDPDDPRNTPDLANVHINNNCFVGNTDGVKNEQTVVSVDATNNWWGAADGPSGAGSGSGDPVSVGVTYDPWATKPIKGVCGPPAPRVVKQDVLAALSALPPTGDKKTDHCIEKAIEHLDKSLDPNLWETDSTLTKKGKKVFDEEKKAVKELMKVDHPDVPGAIDALVAADKTLAQTAIDEASGGGPKEIDKAQDEMTKAQAAYDAGKYDKAIDHYKKAWEHACKAKRKEASNNIKTLAITGPLKVVAYPNPIRDVDTATFRVMGTLATQVEEMRVQIFDLAGRLVWEDQVVGSELDWHTDNQSGQFLANGVYLYQVQVKIDGIWINQDIGKIAVLR